VSGLSPGLNYGQQCYKGLKAFRTVDRRIVVFRPQFHAACMRRSAESVLLCPPPEEVFLKCIRRAVVENAEHVPLYGSDAFMYIRPVLFGALTGLWGACDESILAVFVHPTKPQRGEGAVAAVVYDEFDRCALRGMGSFKVGGNYAPVCNPRDTHLNPFSLPLFMGLSSLAYLVVVDRSGDTWGRQQRWGTVLCYILIA
jgi:branched-chain amino acid aminotransferase